MKKLICILALVASVATLSGCINITIFPKAGKGVKGSGVLIEKQISIDAFHSVDVQEGIRVVISPSQPQESAHIQADDNLMECLVVRVEQGELEIEFADTVRFVDGHSVVITLPALPQLRCLEASSGAVIRNEVAMTAPEVELSASSAAKILATVKAHRCEIDLSSGAGIKASLEVNACEVDASSAAVAKLSGSVAKAHLDASSGGNIDASELAATTCQAEASSAGEISIRCEERLMANASSGGTIHYTGACKVQPTTSSGGRIHNDDL